LNQEPNATRTNLIE